MAFTGLWKLNHTESSKQAGFLVSMDRPNWQIKFIDGADEDFRLIRYTKKNSYGKEVNYLDKKVKIFLNSSLLKALASLLFNKVPFNEVNYHHKLIATGIDQKHVDDSKQFGPCTSKTTWNDQDESFTIRWYILKGLLKVIHTITDKDKLRINMSFTDQKGVETTAFKSYDRHEFTRKDDKYIRTNKDFEFVNGF